jgi:hexosaminidase
LDKVFQCQQKTTTKYSLTITVRSNNLTLPNETGPEAYSLIIRESGIWELEADYFYGFLRGFETYSQLFNQQDDGTYTISGVPIVIDDSPEFKWRGLMIDSSRHFLPLSEIKKTIDGLLFNKMNILHWHIIDQDSFPMQVPSVPELNEYGQVGGSYTPQEMKEVINYAKFKGVRVVVEIDTPAHTHSWGRSEKYRENIVRCNDLYTGQFDPTL